MEGGGGGRCSRSALFSGFRALGLFSSHIPHVVRYHGRHRSFYVTTCVGKSFHTYNVQKLSLVAVSEYAIHSKFASIVHFLTGTKYVFC
ncbi:WD repeat-containing protein 36-like [Macrotis lagotis]|uniref:WD repeat-containing protein 36-like n=1 Tax=Macrotis lagotis TaxID=92651 RepID=UPI003D690E23